MVKTDHIDSNSNWHNRLTPCFVVWTNQLPPIKLSIHYTIDPYTISVYIASVILYCHVTDVVFSQLSHSCRLASHAVSIVVLIRPQQIDQLFVGFTAPFIFLATAPTISVQKLIEYSRKCESLNIEFLFGPKSTVVSKVSQIEHPHNIEPKVPPYRQVGYRTKSLELLFFYWR